MNAVLESDRGVEELAGWGLRGVLCAASSFWWALVAGFNAPVELAGMAVGVGVWVALFAGFCVWHGLAERCGPSRLVPALKIAAWIKFSLSAGGWAVFALYSLLHNATTILDAGFLFVMPDCVLGMAAVGIVSTISGTNRFEQQDSFGWTALTTVVDGALFVIVIGALAAAVLAWWRFRPLALDKLKLSPARSSG